MRSIIFVFLLCLSMSGVWAQTYQLTGLFGSEYFKHENSVRGVAFTPDGKQFVSSSGTEIFFWDRETGKRIRTVDKMLYGILALSFSPDGTKIVLEDSC